MIGGSSAFQGRQLIGVGLTNGWAVKEDECQEREKEEKNEGVGGMLMGAGGKGHGEGGVVERRRREGSARETMREEEEDVRRMQTSVKGAFEGRNELCWIRRG